MTDLITRCPQCSTAFNFKPEHVAASNGAVRCGACLHIFQAYEYMIRPPSQASKPTEKNHKESRSAKRETSNRYTNSHEIHHVDESWALDLINDESEEHDAPLTNNLNDTELNHPAPQIESNSKTSIKHTDTTEPKPALDKAPSPESIVLAETFAKNNNPEVQQTELGSLNESQKETPPTDIASPINVTDLNLVDVFELEPVEFQEETKKSHTRSQWIWSILSIFALITLSLQLAYLNIEKWGLDPRLRPYYDIACIHITCHLPLQEDLSRIHISHITVAPNDHNDTFVVDATFINQAKFEQAFPSLKLSFSDLNHQPVSEYIFTPKDYIKGELTNVKAMPANRSIYIQLNIPNPGEHALNYTLTTVK